MPLTASDKGNGGSYEPVPAGQHVAVCYGVVDLGTKDNTYQGETKKRRQIVILWEIPEERGQFERNGKLVDLPRAISKFYTLSLGEKANLRHDLEAWRGKPFTEDEVRGFDVAKLIGVPCLLQVIHAKNAKGDTRAKVGAIMGLPRGFAKPQQENPTQYFSFEDNGPIPDNIPEWLVKCIKESDQWRERVGAPAHPMHEAEPEPEREPDAKFSDEDIPF